MNTHNNRNKGYFTRTDLIYLTNLDDFKVHEDDTDIRGWNIYDRAGMQIGEVTNLVVDPTERRARYAVVELDNVGRHDSYHHDNFFERVGDDVKDFFGNDDDRHTLIPIGMIQIDNDDHKVHISNFDSNYISNGPRYRYDDKKFFSPNYELATARYYTSDDNDFRDYYRQSRFQPTTEERDGLVNDRSFYDSGLFDRNRYSRNSRNADSTRMASVDTGAKKY